MKNASLRADEAYFTSLSFQIGCLTPYWRCPFSQLLLVARHFNLDSPNPTSDQVVNRREKTEEQEAEYSHDHRHQNKQHCGRFAQAFGNQHCDAYECIE